MIARSLAEPGLPLLLAYSIFLDPESLELLAFAEIEDLDQWQAIADTDVCRRWWASMAPLMEVNDDSIPRTAGLQEVFHIGRD